MQLSTPWKIYSESELERHEPAGTDGPIIYVANDRTCAWMVTRDSQGRSKIQIADIDQITDLWQKYRITSLLAVVKFVGAPSLGKHDFRPVDISHTAQPNGGKSPYVFR
jgi:hypothetical protein